MSYLCALSQFPAGRLHLVGLWEKRTQQLVVRDLWRKIRLEATEQAFWSYKQVIVLIWPKSSKRMQCLRAFVIIALMLLASQQEDGDGLLQNIVKDLGKESRKSLTDGLRDFIKLTMNAP